jgi:hypothetical protein
MRQVGGQRDGPRVLTGLAEAGLPEAVARADRLFFHAALYSNFARDTVMVNALETALARPGFDRLDVVSLDPVARPPYWDEFRGVLRRNMPEATIHREFSVSTAFLDALASRHPMKVRLFLTMAMPLAPILLVGDTIFAGHYAHSPIPAPLGLWLSVPAAVSDLLELAETDANPNTLDPATLGAYRLVYECVAAKNAARRLA